MQPLSDGPVHAPRPGERPGSSGAASARAHRLRPWDRLRVPAPPEDVAELTGFAPRVPRRRTVRVPDPVDGAEVEMAVWEYAASGGVVDAGAAGAVQDGPAPRLVFVHGFRGDHHGLALVADALPEFAVSSLELPGFGDSAAFPVAEHSVAHHADAVAAAVAALGLEAPPVLVAHSYGSIVAAHLVARDPGRWRALVLLNPIAEPALDASGSVAARAAAALAQGYYELSARLPERAGRALLGSPAVVWATTVFMSRTRDRRVLAYTHDQHRRYFSGFASRRMLSQAYRASTTGTVLEAAAGLRLPVALVAGAQDPLGSVAAQERLAGAIAAGGGRARLTVVPGVGHLLHYERPVECARIVRAAAQRPS